MGNDSDQPPNRSLTPVRGMAVLDAEMLHVLTKVADVERRAGKIEAWKNAMAGAEGQPGAFAQLINEVKEMKEMHEAAHGTVSSRFDEQGKRLSDVEHLGFKIVAMASAGSLVGGGVMALVLHLLGK